MSVFSVDRPIRVTKRLFRYVIRSLISAGVNSGQSSFSRFVFSNITGPCRHIFGADRVRRARGLIARLVARRPGRARGSRCYHTAKTLNRRVLGIVVARAWHSLTRDDAMTMPPAACIARSTTAIPTGFPRCVWAVHDGRRQQVGEHGQMHLRRGGYATGAEQPQPPRRIDQDNPPV